MDNKFIEKCYQVFSPYYTEIDCCLRLIVINDVGVSFFINNDDFKEWNECFYDGPYNESILFFDEDDFEEDDFEVLCKDEYSLYKQLFFNLASETIYNYAPHNNIEPYTLIEGLNQKHEELFYKIFGEMDMPSEVKNDWHLYFLSSDSSKHLSDYCPI